ncbi:MAG: alaS [Chloroflexi bacterium]|nr:alaS [Chloroflexota bacterium]
MVVWTSEAVAETYLSFFRERGHLQRASSSLVPDDDPTVLLTTAGMQQMIPYMLGRSAPPASRLCSIQKCFRTTDIGSVGDRRNLTFFEMLGNFSIGDYFKEQMIPWAWELVTEGFGFPVDRLWVTVYPSDDEAIALWQRAGIASDRIVADESNFWGPPGSSGPCGPDTELYYDRGLSFGCGRADCAPGCECERFLEFWNLVFMQYFQDTDGSRAPLARPNIDTGLGLERVTALLQDTPSVYETDLFLPIIRGAEELSGLSYGSNEKSDYSLRVLADHGRAMTFLVADGVLPGNEGRDYVLRRVIRRCVLYGQRVGLDRPFLAELAGLVIDRMAERHSSLGPVRSKVQEIIAAEERRFASTLRSGQGLLDRWIEETRAAGGTTFPGEHVFRLYDTYGFPRELSEEVISDAGLSIDSDGFEAAMSAQRQRSRGSTSFGKTARAVTSSRAVGSRSDAATRFVGYERLDGQSVVVSVERDGASASSLGEGEQGTIVLSESPFYAEGGGQVGDTGRILTSSGEFEVEDTRRDPLGRFLHIGRVARGEIAAGDSAAAMVDPERRGDIMRHHSVTHLLHRSLQLTLGPHAVQAGSLVSPRVARFDFPNEGPLGTAQIEAIEDLVNRHILADLPVGIEQLPFQEAVNQGAAAFFGEKYGDVVRVVTMGDFSKELCGGTHVRTTGEIGAAYVASETGIGSGMRRIEIVAGRAAHELARERSRMVASVAARLGSSAERLDERVDALLNELRDARRETSRLEATLAQLQAAALAEHAFIVGGTPAIVTKVDASSMDALLQMKDALRVVAPVGIIVLGALIEGKPQFIASIGQESIRPGFDAVALVRSAAAVTGGGGGGQPDLARAGGRDPSKLDDALATAEHAIRSELQGRS